MLAKRIMCSGRTRVWEAKMNDKVRKVDRNRARI